jgi:hypothetical protein
MAIELIGTLVQVLPEAGGTSRAGNPWVKQEFILEYQDGQFPKKVCFTAFGNERVADLKKFATGDQVKVSINLESREYNGRWYTEARAWRIEQADGEGASASGPAGEARPQRSAAPSALPPVMSEGDDDLPF